MSVDKNSMGIAIALILLAIIALLQGIQISHLRETTKLQQLEIDGLLSGEAM